METEVAILDQYIAREGIRASRRRHQVLTAFLKTEQHLSVAELYDIVRKKYEGIGVATVYRTMKLICDAGLAQEVDFGDGIMRYEHKHGHKHHDHLICVKCGKYIEVVDEAIEKLQAQLAKRHGFAQLYHTMQIYGTCAKCASTK